MTFLDVGPVHALEIPEFGWLAADGVNPLRVITRGNVYNCGGVAPTVGPTATGGTQASTRLNTDEGGAYVIVDGDSISLVAAGKFGPNFNSYGIEFKTALAVSPGQQRILINGSTANALANLKKFINQTGVEGVDYLTSTGGWPALGQLTAGTLTSTDLTITAVAYGTAGNTYVCTWDGAAGPAFEQESTTTNQTVFSGGTGGSGTTPEVGTYRYFYTHYRDADGAETGHSLVTSMTNGSNGNISLSVLTANADTTFDYTRIYRTAAGGAEFYLLGAVPRATTTFTDDVEDDDLVRGSPYNAALFRAYGETMPPRGRALALWKGRAWTLGAHLHAEYTRGTVDVTPNSEDITFSVLGVTTNMVGRTFQVDATSEEYTIVSVSESAGTAKIDRPYEGANNNTATFAIRDAYDASRLRASVAFLYNQWPVDESPGRVETDDAEGGTALLATDARLFAFSKSSVVAVTGDGPESWEISKIAEGVGCVAPRMVVGVAGGGIFLSRDGFYAINPLGGIQPISSPPARARTPAKGIDGTVARIAWANIDQGYSVYDPVERLVIFGVPLDDAAAPNYEIVFDLQSQTWALYKRAEWTACANVTLPGGGLALLAGTVGGRLWHANLGESDGFYGVEAVATLTSSQTVRTLTASGASWTTAVSGTPVVVLYADGSTVAFGRVASATGTAITLAEDLATAPAAGDQVVVGGIAWQWKTGHMTFGEEFRRKTLRSVTLRHAPTTRGDYFFSFAVDGGSFALPPVGTGIGSLSLASGKVRHMTQWPADAHGIQARGFKPGGRAVFRGAVFDIGMREQGR